MEGDLGSNIEQDFSSNPESINESSNGDEKIAGVDQVTSDAGNPPREVNHPKSVKRKALGIATGVGLLLGATGCANGEINNPNPQNTQEDNTPPVSEQYEETQEVETEVESYTEDGTMPVGTPTVYDTPTPTETPTQTATEVVQETEISPRLTYDLDREFENFGYYLIRDYARNPETGVSEPVLKLTPESFHYDEYKIREDGHYLIGTIDYQGESYPIEILLDPDESIYVISGTAYTLDPTFAEERLREDKEYWVTAQLRRSDGSYILLNSPSDYTDDEWLDIRTQIDSLLKNGGKTPEFDLVLGNLQPKR